MSRIPDKQLPPSGARVKLRREVERWPHFNIEAGATGTVTEASEHLICLRMDEHVPGAEDWDNALCWTPEDGEYIEGLSADATLADRLAAAFHDDAEIIDDGGGS